MNEVKSYLPATRGKMVDQVLSNYTGGNVSQDPTYKKNDRFLSVLRSGTLPTGDVFKILRSGLLEDADYKAISNGYGGDTVASGGVRSDRRKIVSMARYLEKDFKEKDDEIENRLAIEDWNKIRMKTKNGVGEGYNYNNAFFETMSETDTEFDKISYIGNANALSYINHLHRTAWKSGSESETKNLRKLAELYNYIKGGFDDSAGIKTMGELVNDIPYHKLEQEEVDALLETGLGEFEPSHFLKSTLGQRKL